MRYILLSLAALCVVSLSGVQAQTVSLGSSQDANIANGPISNFNLGSFNELLISWSSDPSDPTDISRGLIQFDLSPIPSSAVITHATLTLFQEFNSGNGKTYSLFRNTAAWSESTVTFNTRPAFDPGAVSTLAINDPNMFVPRMWDVTGVVQDWFTGAQVNDGLTLIQDPELPDSYIYFFSKEDADPTHRPVLTVDYRLTGVPEPSACVLFASMGITGAALLARRRRQVRRPG